MKTIIGSNSRPLRRALCTTLIGIAALWAMLGSTHAQVLYVSQEYPIPGTGTVGKYDANTGAVINSSLITGVIHPAGLALLGNTLYVASAVAGGGSVGTYNATTGVPINASFITTAVNQVNQPFALALSGNTLFVSDAGERITTYDVTTGAAFTTVFNPLISGLLSPTIWRSRAPLFTCRKISARRIWLAHTPRRARCLTLTSSLQRRLVPLGSRSRANTSLCQAARTLARGLPNTISTPEPCLTRTLSPGFNTPWHWQYWVILSTWRRTEVQLAPAWSVHTTPPPEPCLTRTLSPGSTLPALSSPSQRRKRRSQTPASAKRFRQELLSL